MDAGGDERSERHCADDNTVKVVGPCKAGKSTLTAGLRALGYEARSCSQEHSEVPNMWQRILPASWLIFLDVSLESIRSRAERSDWDEAFLARQQRRLAHARQHCDLYIATDDLQPADVLGQTVAFLAAQGVQPSPASSPASI